MEFVSSRHYLCNQVESSSSQNFKNKNWKIPKVNIHLYKWCLIILSTIVIVDYCKARPGWALWNQILTRLSSLRESLPKTIFKECSSHLPKLIRKLSRDQLEVKSKWWVRRQISIHLALLVLIKHRLAVRQKPNKKWWRAKRVFRNILLFRLRSIPQTY